VSIGKPGCEAYDAEFNATRPKAEKLSKSLLKRVDLDTQAFNAVMAAFKLPKATDDEKKKRTEEIQRGYKEAVQSPLNIAREGLEVMRLADKLLGKSNPNALSDLGVATKQAHAGLHGAVMNVRINLPSIKDEKFRSTTSSEVSSLLKEGSALTERADEYLSKHIG
jgi:formiminotetrahydrofolate cyclodeaminase